MDFFHSAFHRNPCFFTWNTEIGQGQMDPWPCMCPDIASLFTEYTNLCVSMHHVLIYSCTWRGITNHTVTVITLDQIKWSVCSYLSEVYPNIEGETTAKHDIRILNIIPPEMILNEGIVQLPSIMKHFHNHDFKIIWIMGWPASDHAAKFQLIHLF